MMEMDNGKNFLMGIYTCKKRKPLPKIILIGHAVPLNCQFKQGKRRGVGSGKHPKDFIKGAVGVGYGQF